MCDLTTEKERAYQNRIVEMFKDLGYHYLGKLQYAKGATAHKDGTKNSPIIESELRAFLESQKKYTDNQIKKAIDDIRKESQLPIPKLADLCESNRKTYSMLTFGTKAKPSPNQNEEDVAFFDFKHPFNNRFAIAEEVSYIDPLTLKHSRPDLVVYVNGIALVVIELKRALVSIEEGIRQSLSNERDLIPSFFTTVQFTIAANEKTDTDKNANTGFKYGTIGTPSNFWCNWKNDQQAVNTQLTDAESFERFFNQETFLFLVRYGVINDGGTKKVMRPHQYHALRACQERLKAKASGVIWHSQGSGKSLTMVWLAAYIRDNFKNPRVLVITDRTELDNQIKRTFDHSETPIEQATSKEDLLEKLNAGSPWLISTLIHKYGVAPQTEGGKDNDVKIPLDKYLAELQDIIQKKYKATGGFKVKGENIFVFIDECHRTQGGALHEAMRAIMGQDVMLIGFTGTPLLKDDKKKGYDAFKGATQLRFGSFIHTYFNKNAVDDGVILDLRYEARDVEQAISSKDKLEEVFKGLIKDATSEHEKEIRERWATLEKVYSSKERIERIGYSILDDLSANSCFSQDWCSAMLVAGSIYSAYRYYDFFQNKCSNTSLRDRCAVVTSYQPSDSDLRKDSSDPHEVTEAKFKHDLALQSFKDLCVNDQEAYEAKAKKRFIETPSQMKLLIVVDKLLTGFDAPSATILYIDREMRDHTLFQAICRVNRLGTDVEDGDSHTIKTYKQFGLIVDFKHLFGEIKDTIQRFNTGAFDKFDETDIDGLLTDSIQAGEKRLDAARDAWSSLRSDWLAKGLKTEEEIIADYKTDRVNDPAKMRRAVLYKIAQAYIVAYANLSDYFAKTKYTKEDQVLIYQEVRGARELSHHIKLSSEDLFEVQKYDPKMRALLDRFITAKEAETLVPANADFSFLDAFEDTPTETIIDWTIREAGSERAAAEVIEAKARSVINSFKESDPAGYKRFSEQLQAILDEIRENTLSFRDQCFKVFDLVKEMKTGKNYPTLIDNKCKKALWDNRALWQGEKTPDEEAKALVLKAYEFTVGDAPDGWQISNSKARHLFKLGLEEAFPSPDFTDEQRAELLKLLIHNF
jgi:type I restriction enzyme, R subunit